MQVDTREVYRVFISYSWDSKEHMDWVLKLADALDGHDDIHVVLDQYDLWAGSDVILFMERAMESDRVIMILTPNYAAKAAGRRTGVGYENLLITSEIFRDAPTDRFIPVLKGDPETSIPPYLGSKLYVNMTSEAAFPDKLEELLRGIRRQAPKARRTRQQPPDAQAPPSRTGPSGSAPLADRLTRSDHWPNLLKAAVRAVTAGGTAAMHYYRRPRSWPEDERILSPEMKNPSTIADLEATGDALLALDAHLSRIARQNDCALKYLGEETVGAEWFQHRVSERILDRIKEPPKFFVEGGDELRVILDGIDGTGSFIRGIPLFCSAVAILVGSQPRVAAIYDPIHHVVFSAMMTGPLADPAAHCEAWAWPVATGDRIDLVRASKERRISEMKMEAVGVHFSRSNPETLSVLLQADGSEGSLLERLSRGCGAIYALNSGALAMAEVARGALGGFVNVITNLWDVAAGEVLIRACGGSVTDLAGREIDYSRHQAVSLLAAKAEIHPRLLSLANRRGP